MKFSRLFDFKKTFDLLFKYWKKEIVWYSMVSIEWPKKNPSLLHIYYIGTSDKYAFHTYATTRKTISMNVPRPPKSKPAKNYRKLINLQQILISYFYHFRYVYVSEDVDGGTVYNLPLHIFWIMYIRHNAKNTGLITP